MKSDEGDNNINKKELNQLAEFLQNYRKEIHNSAASLLQQQMPPLTEELFALFEQTGNRLEYEQVYFTRRKFLAILGLEAILLEREYSEKNTELTKTIGIESERKDGTGDRDRMRSECSYRQLLSLCGTEAGCACNGGISAVGKNKSVGAGGGFAANRSTEY